MLCGFLSAQSIIYMGNPQASVLPDLHVQNQPYPALPSLHGFGITQYSTIYPERAFQEAKEKAIYDLRTNLMTSVLLEVYGTETLNPRIRSEFAIEDDIDTDRIVPIDSMRVGNWAVYIVGFDNNDSSLSQSTVNHSSIQNWSSNTFVPVKIGSTWFASGSANWSNYNAERSFILAKQNALQNLSFHLQTVVQGSLRAYNENLNTISYQTSRNILTNIHVVKRAQGSNDAKVLIAVDEDDIITWRE